MLRETISTYQALAICGITFGWGLVIDRRDDSKIKHIGHAILLISTIFCWALM